MGNLYIMPPDSLCKENNIAVTVGKNDCMIDGKVFVKVLDEYHVRMKKDEAHFINLISRIKNSSSPINFNDIKSPQSIRICNGKLMGIQRRELEKIDNLFNNEFNNLVKSKFWDCTNPKH